MLLLSAQTDGSAGAIALGILLVFTACIVTIIKLWLELRSKALPRDDEQDGLKWRQEEKTMPQARPQKVYYVRQTAKRTSKRRAPEFKPVSANDLFVLASAEEEKV